MIAEYNVNLENKTKSELILFIKELQDMLKEKDAEIEKLEQTLAGNIARSVTSSMKESAKSKEDLEMLNAGWQIELEKKDKIIDLLAKAFKQDDVRSIEELKQYFERKATNNG